ncbi:katanin P80 subunit, putative [Ixodes scapularis]|uniref:Katanin P80 subunit, putative n=1 Tax=Ixodes scapularis TaxID=6945 RepID=B7QIJ7_IXOSC|nr:katanin P80 subunit, putative [Ixodes scapularis]|eukprot:XP_002415004.1 katanin P80 subunit, putative [Ixodes scapularis]
MVSDKIGEEFVAHGSTVKCLAIGRKSGRVMVTGGEDNKVNLWAIGKTNCIMVSGPSHLAVSFSSGGALRTSEFGPWRRGVRPSSVVSAETVWRGTAFSPFDSRPSRTLAEWERRALLGRHTTWLARERSPIYLDGALVAAVRMVPVSESDPVLEFVSRQRRKRKSELVGHRVEFLVPLLKLKASGSIEPARLSLEQCKLVPCGLDCLLLGLRCEFRLPDYSAVARPFATAMRDMEDGKSGRLTCRWPSWATGGAPHFPLVVRTCRTASSRQSCRGPAFNRSSDGRPSDSAWAAARELVPPYAGEQPRQVAWPAGFDDLAFPPPDVAGVFRPHPEAAVAAVGRRWEGAPTGAPRVSSGACCARADKPTLRGARSRSSNLSVLAHIDAAVENAGSSTRAFAGMLMDHWNRKLDDQYTRTANETLLHFALA